MTIHFVALALTANRTRATKRTTRNCYVVQYLRPHVSSYDLWREPWERDRQRGGRLSTGYSAQRDRYSALPRQAPARAVALQHAAAGAEYGQDRVRRVRRCRVRPAGYHRH